MGSTYLLKLEPDGRGEVARHPVRSLPPQGHRVGHRGDTKSAHDGVSVTIYHLGQGVCDQEASCAPPTEAFPGSFWVAGRAAPDLGIGAVAIFHRVLGLHQLLRFLNHLAPEPSDTLLGTKSCDEGPGAACCGHRLRVPPPPPSRGMGLREPLCPFGPQFPNLPNGTIKLLLNGCKEWVPDPEFWAQRRN